MNFIVLMAFPIFVSVFDALAYSNIETIINELTELNLHKAKENLHECFIKNNINVPIKDEVHHKTFVLEFDRFLNQIRIDLVKKTINPEDVPSKMFEKVYKTSDYNQEMYVCSAVFIRNLCFVDDFEMSSEEMENRFKKHISKAKTFLHDCFNNYDVCQTVIDKENLFKNGFWTVIQNSLPSLIYKTKYPMLMTEDILNYFDIKSDQNRRFPKGTDYIRFCSAAFYVSLFGDDLQTISRNGSILNEKMLNCCTIS
ncbi:uncharacterized protein LOC126895235 [Daktulosphaira vitifoliae]|uniref:uncharacterized protein LOC126895235 n=1 Tax=Daktulosphaira vitifoliae TaxID=58002 RepID=UPI0021AACE6B|nr:uncharacterized protein LOC126895235 [Daktulosphaira vitifoliae]